MLKNVVFPAPFGPIRLTMERSGMLKSTELTATRPPKTLVIPRASRMLAVSASFSGTGPVSDGVGARGVPLVQLLGPLSVGYYPFRPQEHHQPQDDAVDAPHAAQDDHGEDQDRDVEREARREDVLYERPVVRTRKPAEYRPHGVGPELGRHRVDAHRVRRRLVLAHGDPGAPQPGVPETYVHVDRDQHQDDYRIVPRVQIQSPEALPGG